jgi:hypothetical protein
MATTASSLYLLNSSSSPPARRRRSATTITHTTDHRVSSCCIQSPWVWPWGTCTSGRASTENVHMSHAAVRCDGTPPPGLWCVVRIYTHMPCRSVVGIFVTSSAENRSSLSAAGFVLVARYPDWRVPRFLAS